MQLLVHKRGIHEQTSGSILPVSWNRSSRLEVELLAVKVERSNDGAIGFNGRRYLRHIGSSSHAVPRWIICFRQVMPAGARRVLCLGRRGLQACPRRIIYERSTATSPRRLLCRWRRTGDTLSRRIICRRGMSATAGRNLYGKIPSPGCVSRGLREYSTYRRRPLLTAGCPKSLPLRCIQLWRPPGDTMERVRAIPRFGSRRQLAVFVCPSCNQILTVGISEWVS